MAKRLSPDILNQSHDHIRGVLCDALGVYAGEVTPDALLVGDLGAEAVDFLDIVYRIEKTFGIKIPREELITDDDILKTPKESKIHHLTVKALVDFVISKQVSSGELIVETEMLRFFLGPDDRIHAAMSIEDGSWGYADVAHIFPSHLAFIGKGRWADVLEQLEELINDPKVTEQTLQSFFERHPDLVKGSEYDVVVPQAILLPIEYETEWYMDFVVRPINSNAFAKILELKKPQVPLVKKTRFHQNPFSSQLYEAIQQLRRYSRAFSAPSVRREFRERHGIDVYRPDLHLIAGRAWDIELADRFRDFVRDEQVFIEDWDSALQRLRRKFT